MKSYRLRILASAVILTILFLSIWQESFGAGVVEDKFNQLATQAQDAVLTNEPFVSSTVAAMGTYNVDYPHVTYQQYNMIDLVEPWINNFLDKDGWWVQQRPRGGANINKISLNKYVGTSWQELAYNVNIFNWSKAVGAGLTPGNIPAGAQYHVGIKIGHLVGSNSYPEIANIGGTGYFRLTGLSPMEYGASNRVFGYRMFDQDEYAPETRFLYGHITNAATLEVALLSESAEVIGATWLKFNFNTAGGNYSVDVKSKFFARKSLPARDRGVSPFLVSTMYWKPQAHDSDTVSHIVDGRLVRLKRLADPTTLTLTNLGMITANSEIRIAQEERDPAAYGYFPEAPYHLRSSFRLTNVKDTSDQLELIVIESPTGDEYADNVVVALREKNAVSKNQLISISYTLEPYFTLPPAQSSVLANNWMCYN